MSGNGIEPEEPPLSSVGFSSHTFDVARLKRNVTGDWSLTLEIDTTAELPDGRTARFVGQLRIRGRQRGRKPRKAKER